MKNIFFVLILNCIVGSLFGQSALSPLTIEKIMRDPSWIGASPSNPHWSSDGKKLFFKWNPDNNPADSLYFITGDNKSPQKVAINQLNDILYAEALVYNNNRSSYVYEKDGDIFIVSTITNKIQQVTQTNEYESNPVFAFGDKRVVYRRNQNLYAWDIASGETIQLTNFQPGEALLPEAGEKKLNEQEEWLKNDQLRWIKVLKERKQKRDEGEAYRKTLPKEKSLKAIYTGDKYVAGLQISADGRFISYKLVQQSKGNRATIVPNYVTENGFTEDIPSRSKVGESLSKSGLFVIDREADTVIAVKTDSIPGITDLPDYVKDYPQLQEKNKKPEPRAVDVINVSWSPAGTYAVVDMASQDNKDRWLMRMDAATGKLLLLDRQRNEAWIDGVGIENKGWINENTFWYESEASGYAQLYSVNIITGQKKQITSGKYEVQKCRLSSDKKYFYISTNEVHPGELQFYRLPITGGKAERITGMEGANQVVISPDEKQIAFLYSYSNKPWELYVQENKPGAKAQQVTFKAQSDAFKSYAWRDPELIQFKARDGANVYARLYKPVTTGTVKPAIIFVHGAGYLQNAHKWWSYYFREFMFHNLLADNGYYVLDLDYRGSAGYGRDWRTGIYRFMGGKDLTDNIDGAKWLVDQFGVDPKRIGIYGGSYGGFITLMALFTSPGTFAAGAALRPVTDWAHYNHGYTSNILNEPAKDSIAYRRSSPIYFAEGLQDHLLICHGVVDENVHFQDVMRLNQRLIELGKNNWQVAMFPVEDHSFVEPSSWTDEYKRIYKLFEEVLKK
ncbi:MAG: prolyl oligopeptidase family serine peptidase [Agriterribacter sp.]